MWQGQLVIELVHVFFPVLCFGHFESGDDEFFSSCHGFDVGAISDEPVSNRDADLVAKNVVLLHNLNHFPWNKRFIDDDIALDICEVAHHVFIAVLVMQGALDEMVHTCMFRLLGTDLLKQTNLLQI